MNATAAPTGQTDGPPANVAVFQMASAALVSRALCAVAELGIADLVRDEGTAVSALAAETGSNEDALYRVLRMLAANGVFRELEGRGFAHTPMSEVLRADHPTHANAAVQMVAGDGFWRAFGEFMHSVKTGGTAWEKAFGMPIFEFLGQTPEAGAMFNDAMIGIHGSEPPAVAASYGFEGMERVVDVGGGSGNLMIQVLREHRGIRGVIYELPDVAAVAQRRIAAEGLAERCEVEAGNFFEAIPQGADGYLLSHVIHDWREEQCLTILGNCRQAMKPDSKLLLVEMVVPGPNEPHPAKLLDLVMLTMPGGRERTEDEYGELLAKAGLRLERVVPTPSPVSVIEAVVA